MVVAEFKFDEVEAIMGQGVTSGDELLEADGNGGPLKPKAGYDYLAIAVHVPA